MGNIVLLDELTINKIAAGEVIERPASVIKEMVENSIDANATNITIEIRNGGISYIKITDNGKGIARDDLEMTFERHATSKIRSAEDLNTVTSMGFRGEAMASIAAISNVELISKTAEQDIGYKVIVEGGRIIEKQEVGCQTGTTITVSNLFFNTPVRYKFLKKDYTETGYIEDVVTRLALVNPNIAFKLINTGKTIIQTAGNGDLKSVIYSIYGKDIAQGIVDVNYTYDDIKVAGIAGKPEIARSNRSNQLFFVNKRYVRDKILTAATEQAYKGKIDSGKFGFVVLNIEMNPSKVDVNVHPAKLEVRFEEESKVFQAIYHSIKDSLEKSPSETITKVDNIVIQSNDYTPKKEEIIETEKPKSLGFFGWKRNKELNEYVNKGNDENIIADLYNSKKTEELSETKFEKEDNVVNTSDVLEELKQLKDTIKKDTEESIIIKEEKTMVEPQKEEKALPDGTTYTYVGENKEKIEDLLRQLHPETYKAKKVAEEPISYTFDEQTENNTQEIVDNSVEEQKTEILAEVVTEPEIKEIESNTIANVEEQVEENPEVEQNQIPSEQITQKFDLIRENLKKLDETQAVPTIKVKEDETENFGEEKPNVENKYNDEDENGPKPKAFQKPFVSNSSEFNQMYEKTFGTTVREAKEPETKDERFNAVDIIKDNVSVFEGIGAYQKPTYKSIGTVFENYIIAEIEKEMYIINVLTAKEKVIYEKIKKNYYNNSEKDSQMLLLPDIIELSPKENEILKENKYIFEKAGFVFEEFGDNTIKLTGVPTICMELDTKRLFVQTLDEINTVARTSKQEKEEKFISTIASKVAQNSRDDNSMETINTMMDELLSLKNPFEYNFEKTIAIKMTKYDIERKFSRK